MEPVGGEERRPSPGNRCPRSCPIGTATPPASRTASVCRRRSSPLAVDTRAWNDGGTQGTVDRSGAGTTSTSAPSTRRSRTHEPSCWGRGGPAGPAGSGRWSPRPPAPGARCPPAGPGRPTRPMSPRVRRGPAAPRPPRPRPAPRPTGARSRRRAAGRRCRRRWSRPGRRGRGSHRCRTRVPVAVFRAARRLGRPPCSRRSASESSSVVGARAGRMRGCGHRWNSSS